MQFYSSGMITIYLNDALSCSECVGINYDPCLRQFKGKGISINIRRNRMFCLLYDNVIILF